MKTNTTMKTKKEEEKELEKEQQDKGEGEGAVKWEEEGEEHRDFILNNLLKNN